MTQEDITKQVRIPVWLIVLITSLILSVLGYLLNQAAVQQRTITEIERVRKDLDRHIERTQYKFKEKADIREVDNIHITLQRIEKKLDNELSKK